MARNYFLDEQTVGRKLQRIAYEILERNVDESEILLIGIKDNGSVIAANMQQLLQSIASIKVDLIHLSLDKRSPAEIILSEQPDFNNKVVIMVDDVSNSGKTLLYAMKPLLNSFPKKIQTLVLVERTHKAFPVSIDYVGLSLATTLQEHIYVEVEGAKVTGAYME
jgi:pyrimidine operon attenuation protein / uracil phosphoribosyltransferase